MNDELTIEQMEAYVRARWEVKTAWGRIFPGHETPSFHLSLPVLWCGSLNVMFAETPEKAWRAAYDFTRERERQIAEKREEIEWVRAFAFKEVPKIARILSVLEAQLAELQRGWKGE